MLRLGTETTIIILKSHTRIGTIIRVTQNRANTTGERARTMDTTGIIASMWKSLCKLLVGLIRGSMPTIITQRVRTATGEKLLIMKIAIT